MALNYKKIFNDKTLLDEAMEKVGLDGETVNKEIAERQSENPVYKYSSPLTTNYSGTLKPATSYTAYAGNNKTSTSQTYDIPSYSSKYATQIDALLSQLGNREFSYDQESDPLYKQYADMYQKNGKSAMQNTLAEVSARTGGLASSYAGSAAQQTYNNYMDQLNDKGIDLYQLALSKYSNDTDEMRNNLSTLMSLDNADYSRWSDRVSMEQSAKEAANSATDSSDSSYAVSDVMSMLESAGVPKNADYAKAQLLMLGYDSSTASSIANAYATTEETQTKTSADVYSDLYGSGISGNYETAYADLIARGYSKDEASALATGYLNSYSTLNDNYFKSLGVNNGEEYVTKYLQQNPSANKTEVINDALSSGIITEKEASRLRQRSTLNKLSLGTLFK